MTDDIGLDLKQMCREAIDKNEGMLSELIALYIQIHGGDLKTLSLIADSSFPGRIVYSIADKREEPWRTIETLNDALLEARREAEKWRDASLHHSEKHTGKAIWPLPWELSV